MQSYAYQTTRGKVFLRAPRPTPNVVMIHGFKRRVDQLVSWAERIPDLGFVHLPGHGGAAPFAEANVEAWADGIGQAFAHFPKPPLIIAESLGAMVAMNVPATAIIAVEPLLSVDQLWPLHRTIRNARARGMVVEPELLSLFEQPFHWVLDRISVPTLVLAGDVPLLPERAVFPEPSLLTDEDFAAYAAHPRVTAARVAGGHTLLDVNPQGVMEAAAGFMTRHGYLAGTPAGAVTS